MHWQPTFARVFIAVLILTGWVLKRYNYRKPSTNRRVEVAYQNGNANNAIGVDLKRAMIIEGVNQRWKILMDLLLGCHIGVVNRILGGESGKSSGKLNRALKIPPSLFERYIVRACIFYRRATDRSMITY